MRIKRHDGGDLPGFADQSALYAPERSKGHTFSSTQPGEGKSFVTGNLAVSLAYLGKKVVVVGMDIRKLGLNKVFDLSKRQEGISNYLMDPEDKDLFDLVQPSGISPNLDIL